MEKRGGGAGWTESTKSLPHTHTRSRKTCNQQYAANVCRFGADCRQRDKLAGGCTHFHPGDPEFVFPPQLIMVGCAMVWCCWLGVLGLKRWREGRKGMGGRGGGECCVGLSDFDTP